MEIPPDLPPGRLRRSLRVARPWLFLAGAALVVALAGLPGYQANNLVFEYALRATVAGLVVAGALAWWWSNRRGQTWGFDLIPALLGGIGGLALAGALKGTPYAPGGLTGDQSFRTASITRFADGWQLADFTFQGLPAFYAPAYFWILGRAADLGGLEAWRMTKIGTVLAALLVPVVTYLLWRRLVPIQVAALLAVVPLVIENFYEPYAWLVIFAIVPWWLESVHGLRRPGRRPGNLFFLGAVGGLLFLTYYYFFFIAAIALVIHIVVERMLGELRWRQIRRGAAVLGIAAALSAVYWLPLAVSMLRAEHTQSLANRWFNTGHPRFPLPMLELSVTGAVALLGLVYLVWTAKRDALSRGLLVFLAAAYGWYLLGAAAAVADTPLLSFRGKPLIPLVLLIGGVLAAVHIVRWAAARFSTTDVHRVAWVLGVLLVTFAGQELVTTVRDSSLMDTAHATPLPDAAAAGWESPDWASTRAAPQPGATAVPPAELQQAIADRHSGEENPVLLSDRVDIMALYPNYGFLQWNAHYAHPASEFRERVDFLAGLADATPAEFASQTRDNRFGPIDGFVLAEDGDELVYRFSDDAFPGGTQAGEIRFPRTVFSPQEFDLVPMGDHLLAMRRS